MTIGIITGSKTRFADYVLANRAGPRYLHITNEKDAERHTWDQVIAIDSNLPQFLEVLAAAEANKQP